MHMHQSSGEQARMMDNTRLGLVDELGVFEDALVEVSKPWVSMVLSGHVHGS